MERGVNKVKKGIVTYQGIYERALSCWQKIHTRAQRFPCCCQQGRQERRGFAWRNFLTLHYLPAKNTHMSTAFSLLLPSHKTVGNCIYSESYTAVESYRGSMLADTSTHAPKKAPHSTTHTKTHPSWVTSTASNEQSAPLFLDMRRVSVNGYEKISWDSQLSQCEKLRPEIHTYDQECLGRERFMAAFCGRPEIPSRERMSVRAGEDERWQAHTVSQRVTPPICEHF